MTTGCRDYVRARTLGELQEQRSHAARRRLDENRVSRPDPGAIDQNNGGPTVRQQR